MPDKINKIFTVGAGWLRGPDGLPGIESGRGYYLDAGVTFPDWDKALSLSLSGNWASIDTIGKIMPDADPNITGSYTTNNHRMFSAEWGSWIFKESAATSGGRRWLVLKTGSHAGLSLGWIMPERPEGNVAGETSPGDSDKWTSFTARKKTGIGLELWPTDNFQIVPEIGILTAATHVFVDASDFREWPFSSQDLQLYIGLSLGFGQQGSWPTDDRGLTTGEIARHISNEIHGLIYSIILYGNFREPQSNAQERLGRTFSGEGDGGMTGGGNTWFVPSLQSISMSLDAGNAIGPVGFYMRAPHGWNIAGVVTEAVKGTGFLMAGQNGDAGDVPLLTPGLTAMNNLTLIGINKAGVGEKYLPLAAHILHGAEILISLAKDQDEKGGASSPLGQALLGAGALTSAGWAQDPEQGMEDVIQSSGGYYSPATLVLAGASGMASSFGLINRYKDLPFFTGFELTTPLISMSNLGTFLGNNARTSVEEKSYDETEMPSFVTTTLGAEILHPLDPSIYVKAGGGINLITEMDFMLRGGIGITGNVGIGFNIFKSTYLEIGAKASLFKTRGDGGALIQPITIGLGSRG